MLPIDANTDINTKNLTRRQKQVLDFLMEFSRDMGFCPSLRDICAHLGINGPQNARKHLNALEKKGFITRQAGISRAIRVVSEISNTAADTTTVPVPILGRVQAGAPHPAIEDAVGYVNLDARFFGCRNKDVFLLQAQGESMINAGIDHGDYLLVNPGSDANNGDIIVAMIDGEATVKRFFRQGNKIILRPENQEMEDFIIDGNTFSGDFSIVGKVVSVIKQLGN